MTLPAFLTQVGTLLLIGILALLALSRTNRPHPPSRPIVQADPRPMTRRFSRLSIDESWTPEQCAEVFEALEVGEEFHFFAADVPSPSDPGGYVEVRRSADGGFLRWVGNHGWHLDWAPRTLEEMRDELHRNRAAQAVLVNETPISQAYRLEKRA